MFAKNERGYRLTSKNKYSYKLSWLNFLDYKTAQHYLKTEVDYATDSSTLEIDDDFETDSDTNEGNYFIIINIFIISELFTLSSRNCRWDRWQKTFDKWWNL